MWIHNTLYGISVPQQSFVILKVTDENISIRSRFRSRIRIQIRIRYPFYIVRNETPKNLQSKFEPYFYLEILHRSELDPQKYVV
jgi:hypothetical protein